MATPEVQPNGTLHTAPPVRAESFQSAVSEQHAASAETQETNGEMKNPTANGHATDPKANGHAPEEWAIPTDGPLKTPIPKPLPSCKPPPPAPLTAEQQAKYKTVHAAVSEWTTIPSTTAKNAPQAPVTEAERMWFTRECLLRYLRATKWKTADTLKRLEKTLSWRREYGADTFTFDYISPENETGKQCILGYDNEARPCLYLNPSKQNTSMSDRQIHHLCFMLDRTIDMMPPGQENSALIINFKSSSNGQTPSVSQARQTLNILQNHNPERLGKALISELPWYVSTFFKLISPFIDPVTREKMKFNEDLRKWVPPSLLWNQHEGDLNFEYDHSAYWPALEQMTTQRRQLMRERWEKGGKLIGEYEEYLRGGDRLSLQQELDAESASATDGVANLSVKE